MPLERPLHATAVCATALLLSALSSTAFAAEEQATQIPEDAAHVEIVDFMRFDPKVIEVPPGTTVVWTNYDGSNHKVTLPDGAKSGRMHMESTWSHTFSEAGTYEYHCSMHPRMKGTVIVKSP